MPYGRGGSSPPSDTLSRIIKALCIVRFRARHAAFVARYGDPTLLLKQTRNGNAGRRLRRSTRHRQRASTRPHGPTQRLFCGGHPRRTFRDRREAGRVLAGELASYRGRDGLLVFGLARGGVPVGWEVAAALGAELDVFLVRKLGVPQWPELAMGALASGGGVVMNAHVVSSLSISDEQVRAVVDREAAELIGASTPTAASGRSPTRVAGRSSWSTTGSLPAQACSRRYGR